MAHFKRDPDKSKGAVEAGHETAGNPGMEEQLGHRDQDPLIKDSDTDFPEPGLSPEHTGEPKERKKSA